MNTEATKDVVINEQLFRIGRMTAMVGSRIANLLLSAMIKIQADQTPGPENQEAKEAFQKLTEEERAGSAVVAMWIAVGAEVSEERYAQIQMQCLQVCSMYPTASGAAPIPLVTANGRWAVRELETNIQVVNQLIQEALKFNLAPFFTESASSGAAAPTAAPVSSPPNTPRATGTLPGR